MQYTLILLFVYFSPILAIRQCLQDKAFFKYYKIKTCFRSNLPTISWKNFNNVKDCAKFARGKNGLAFNFSPPELKNLTQNRYFRNCQVLGCPDTQNSSTLAFDPAFDYYSAYGDLNCEYNQQTADKIYYSRLSNGDPLKSTLSGLLTLDNINRPPYDNQREAPAGLWVYFLKKLQTLAATSNATCIKSLGLFDVINHKKKYTDAIVHCQSLGGDLADILTEFRTNSLANLLKSMSNWYKGAYVGLSDVTTEGTFETPMGNLLQCSQFIAWSPGHPRPNRKREDCVVLDSERTWRAINCKVKLRFICEFRPAPPPKRPVVMEMKNCSMMKSKKVQQQCLADNELFQLYNASKRIDQCALLNDFE